MTSIVVNDTAPQLLAATLGVETEVVITPLDTNVVTPQNAEVVELRRLLGNANQLSHSWQGEWRKAHSQVQGLKDDVAKLRRKVASRKSKFETLEQKVSAERQGFEMVKASLKAADGEVKRLNISLKDARSFRLAPSLNLGEKRAFATLQEVYKKYLDAEERSRSPQGRMIAFSSSSSPSSF